jgi:hypothetical protein
VYSAATGRYPRTLAGPDDAVKGLAALGAAPCHQLMGHDDARVRRGDVCMRPGVDHVPAGVMQSLVMVEDRYVLCFPRCSMRRRASCRWTSSRTSSVWASRLRVDGLALPAGCWMVEAGCGGGSAFLLRPPPAAAEVGAFRDGAAAMRPACCMRIVKLVLAVTDGQR